MPSARRVSCPFCDQSAASESALNAHVREQHHGPRPSRRGPAGPYLAHAYRYGVEGVMEAACVDLSKLGRTPTARVKTLATLAKGLRAIDRRFKIPPELDRTYLWHDQGHDAQTIADIVGVTAAVVRRRIRDLEVQTP